MKIGETILMAFVLGGVFSIVGLVAGVIVGTVVWGESGITHSMNVGIAIGGLFGAILGSVAGVFPKDKNNKAAQ